MKVIDIIKHSDKTFASFELVPPLKGNDATRLYQSIEPLMEFAPPFINITYHRDEIQFKEKGNGVFEKVTVTKRPGMVAIVAAIMRQFEVEVVSHLICGGASKQKLENDLLDLNFLGIQNIVALRGDAVYGEKFFFPEPDGFCHSNELVQQIYQMNAGIYLDKNITNGIKTDFCTGVAGYPEKHCEAPNQEEDILNLKKKIDAGAEYIITQMFFDNRKFFNFVKKCRDAGIDVPIIPGLKPVSTYKHIEMLPRTFSIDIPEILMNAIKQCKSDEHIYQVGVEWCISQSKELLQQGVPAIHYYTMGKANNIKAILKEVF
jgi:methylenetetrahydrofolate reductase (NADPH)